MNLLRGLILLFRAPRSPTFLRSTVPLIFTKIFVGRLLLKVRALCVGVVVLVVDLDTLSITDTFIFLNTWVTPLGVGVATFDLSPSHGNFLKFIHTSLRFRETFSSSHHTLFHAAFGFQLFFFSIR